MALEKILKNSSGVPTGEYERIAGGTLYADNPIGAIVPFGGTDIPAGFLLCNGAEVLKTDYAELYAVIGDAFGTASVNTKFVLPDLREATTKGAGLTGNSSVHYDTDGVALGEFIEDRIQNHIHRFSSDNSNVGTANCAREGGAVSQNRITPDSEVINARSGATTEVKSVGVNYIIKAKMVALPADLESAVADAVDEAMADTGWVTVNSYVKARRIGKMVSLELTFAKSAISAAGWTKVADLEARFRPSKQIIGCAYIYVTGSEIQFDNYFINAAGAVNLLGNTDLVASATYFAD